MILKKTKCSVPNAMSLHLPPVILLQLGTVVLQDIMTMLGVGPSATKQTSDQIPCDMLPLMSLELP